MPVPIGLRDVLERPGSHCAQAICDSDLLRRACGGDLAVRVHDPAYADRREEDGVRVGDAEELDFEAALGRVDEHAGDDAPLLEGAAVGFVRQATARGAIHVVVGTCEKGGVV